MNTLITTLKRCAKAAVATVGGVVEAAVPFVPVSSKTGHVLALLVAILTAAGVYGVRNTRPAGVPAIYDRGAKAIDDVIAGMKAVSRPAPAAPDVVTPPDSTPPAK